MNKAFTLAEVLITLGIIGIVAAMTLPGVFRDIRNKELESRFKKSYSILSYSIQLIIEQEYGGVASLEQKQHAEFGKLLKSYIGTSKTVGVGRWGTSEIQPWLKQTYKNFGGGATDGIFNDYAFYTSDGSATVFLDTGHELKFPEIFIAIDINSVDNKPNKYGYDFFGFYLDKKGQLLPFGEPNSYVSETKGCIPGNSAYSKNGLGCTIKALTDKDYFKNLPR